MFRGKKQLTATKQAHINFANKKTVLQKDILPTEFAELYRIKQLKTPLINTW
jgi:hypothetical protein